MVKSSDMFENGYILVHRQVLGVVWGPTPPTNNPVSASEVHGWCFNSCDVL